MGDHRVARFLLYRLLVYGFCALFAIYTGDAFYSGGSEFGIPTVHVLPITFTLFFAINHFHQFISNIKPRLLLYYLAAIVPFVFLQERSNIRYVLMGLASFYYITKENFIWKNI